MKKKLLFIFALLCAVAQGVQAKIINLSTLTVSDIPTGVVAENGDVLTGTLYLRIKVSIAAGASVTLDNATIICAEDDSETGGDRRDRSLISL